MERYIAVDAGKFATKVAEYIPAEDRTIRFSYRTRKCAGDFRDDAIERSTMIFEYDGNVYKVGSGARGEGADMETNKSTQIHKICTLAAIARLCTEGETDQVNVAIGMPAKEWENVDKREAYKAFILPDGEIHAKVKESSEAPVKEKTFIIERKYVFPESIGALFMDDSPEITPNSYVGVLDIGNLNLNATIWQGVDLQGDESITDELGGNIMIQGLSQELSSRFTRCDERFVAQIMNMRPEERYLRPKNGDKRIIEESRKVIADYLLEHTRRIKQCVNTRKWSLDYMDLIAIGGTSKRLENELQEVFGASICIPRHSMYCNVLGYLRILCSKLFPERDKMIPID